LTKIREGKSSHHIIL